jgi:hypothetical protein
MHRALSLLLLIGLEVHAEELLLVDEAARVTVTVAPFSSLGADTQGRSLVQWRNAPGEPTAGVAVFERVGVGRAARLAAVGGGAGFFLRPSSRPVLSKGSTLAAWELVVEEQQPLVLGSVSGEVNRAALEQAYRDAHGFTAGKAQAEALLEAARAKTNKACASSLSVKVDWSAFKDKGLPGVATGVLASLEALCADADYRKAVQGLEQLDVSVAGGADLELVKDKRTLSFRVRADVANPAVRARRLLEDSL